MSRFGAQGFDGAEPELALGAVTGVRWWNLTVPGSDLAYLHGVQGRWEPGVNVAGCHHGFGVSHAVPDEDCGCGFWAYWTVEAAPNPWGFTVPILGIVEGYGRTLIGERGFRCAKARMKALWFSEGTRHLAAARLGGRRLEPWELSDAPDFLKMRGKAAVETWHRLTGRAMPKTVPAPEPGAEDAALARLARLELDLEERYGVPVYCTKAMLLAMHPPTTDYLP